MGFEKQLQTLVKDIGKKTNGGDSNLKEDTNHTVKCLKFKQHCAENKNTVTSKSIVIFKPSKRSIFTVFEDYLQYWRKL